MPTLIVHQSGDPPKFADVDGELINIGRDPTCDVVLDSRMVSRRHAIIRRLEHRKYAIESLKKANPVVVNGQVVPKTADLLEGDEIQIAKFFVVFSMAPDARVRYSGRVYRASCEACDWIGNIRLKKGDPVCPSCKAPLVNPEHDLTGTGSKPTAQQDSTYYMQLDSIKKLHTKQRGAARLVRLTGKPGWPVRYDLDQSEVCTLGRPRRSSMPVRAFVLGRPPAVSFDRESYFIRPGGFLPKVTVNGRELKGKRKLTDRDVIQVGKTKLSFRV